MLGFKIRRLSRTSGRHKCACATATVTSATVAIAIFALSALNLRQNRFNLNDYQAHLGDDIAVSRFADDLSAKFCSEYEIEMWDRNEVYLLPAPALVDKTAQRAEQFEIRYVPGVFDVDSRGFYLLDNSTIHLAACQAAQDPARGEAEMILYRGHVDRHRRRRQTDPADNEIERVQIPPSAICNTSSALPELEHRVTEEDNYYVLVRQKARIHVFGTDVQRHDEGTVFVNGTLTRTEYDVTKAKATCRDHYLCRFSLDFEEDGDADVVVRLGNKAATPLAGSSFSTHCHPRVLFWVAIFGALPLVLVVGVIAFWVWFYCVKLPALDAKRCTCKRHGCAEGDNDVTSASGRGRAEGRRLLPETAVPDSSYGSVQ